MINKPPPFKGLNIRIPIVIPIKGRGFINQGSTLNPKAPRASFFASFVVGAAAAEDEDAEGTAIPRPGMSCWGFKV